MASFYVYPDGRIATSIGGRAFGGMPSWPPIPPLGTGIPPPHIPPGCPPGVPRDQHGFDGFRTSPDYSHFRPRNEHMNQSETERWTHYTEDGGWFIFSTEHQNDGSWRSYIIRQPSYRERMSDSHTTHRLSDRGRKYVCWTRPLESKNAAKRVAKLWAEHTQAYIKTGRRF